MYNVLCDAIHQELDALEDKFAKGGAQMTGQDLDHIDKMFHALKSLATYEAMKGGSEYDGLRDGDSYARGRSRTTGRYISRDGGSYDSMYRRY